MLATSVEGWLGELGLAPIDRVEREGAVAWDLVLDGRVRRGVRLTLILDPALALVCWVHYAPPLTDMVRKVFRQLLRWNDELPLVKFALAEDERPVLSAEVAVDRLDRDAIGLTIARLLAVCDLLYPESAEWVDRIERGRLRLGRGRPLPAPSEPPDPAGDLLLTRYAAQLGELVATGSATTADDDITVRTAARIVLLDPADRVLLLGARDPADGRVVWFLPGGGVEPGEDLAQAAVRELAEEVPLAGTPDLRGPVWRRRHQFSWNARRVDQTEWFFVGRLADPLDAADVHVGGAEERFFEGARWASSEDLAAWPPATIMAPRRLPELLERLLAGEWPTEPIDTGV